MTYQDLYLRSIEHPEEFWREQAEQISWHTAPQTILSQDDDGYYRWYCDGKLNTAYLALDWHVAHGRGGQLALIYDSPVTGSQQAFTYEQLLDRTARFAGALKRLGVDRGDTVVIYMPMIPEAIIGMLACARIGAIHSVVFGGFAAHELAIRIDHAQPKVLLTASAGKEVDRIVDYSAIISTALAEAKHPPERCVVLQRAFCRADLQTGRDLDWEEVSQAATSVPCLPVESNHPLYILYTSGTTGTPKGVVRDHGGHAVAMKFSMSAIYDTDAGDVFWAASDVGWVVGHSYIVYGPLIQGCTTVLYEGKPVRTPDAGAFWRVVDDHNVNVLFTAPTAIRAVMREDPGGRLRTKYDTSSLRYLFLAGERCDVTTLQWARDLLGVPVVDHWWQTESGWPMIANMPGIEFLAVKPGSSAKPVCGYSVKILGTDGRVLPCNEEGAIAIRLPLPPGCLLNLWHDRQRFEHAYLTTFPGFYASGDGGYQDEDGYVFITGRLDDIINVAGHRLSTATMEEVVAAHPDVAECAVIGMSDELKGEVPIGFVTLKADTTIDCPTLQAEIVDRVREQVGHIASLQRVLVVDQLPKTRSGKILRRTMRAMVEGEQYRVPSTIEEPAVLDDLASTIRQHRLVRSR